MPKSDPVAELAQKLLYTLEQLRQSSSDYPLTVARLAALTDPQATPEQVSKALGKKPFAPKWLIANKKDPNSLVVLLEDGERLAASPLLLEYALGRLCSADKPLHTPAKVIGKVDKALKPAFQAALERQIAEQTLPSTVGVLLVRGKSQLHLRRFPPPKPPAEELSAKLVQALIEQRERGPDAYPAALDRLIEQTDMAPASTVLKKALAGEPFRSRAVLALPNLPDGPVALTDDRERLVSSPALLLQALTAARTANTQAVTIAELKKKIGASLQGAFAEAVNRHLRERVLPDGIGVLLVKSKPLLFLLADINAGSLPPRSASGGRQPPVGRREQGADAPRSPMDFAHLFDEAFARLDREHGSHNHVSLVALRRAVPVERAAFDAALQQLRRSGRYSLSAAEGRHGLSADERNAGIPEDGSLLLFVSRREM